MEYVAGIRSTGVYYIMALVQLVLIVGSCYWSMFYQPSHSIVCYLRRNARQKSAASQKSRKEPSEIATGVIDQQATIRIGERIPKNPKESQRIPKNLKESKRITKNPDIIAVTVPQYNWIA